ncbi:hypothetical protein Cus16_0618 [Curtobacterium sp. ER1/6]|nr:hypothetical protein Cus16_0618 [Curtobacterium sp. ER1/6]
MTGREARPASSTRVAPPVRRLHRTTQDVSADPGPSHTVARGGAEGDP